MFLTCVFKLHNLSTHKRIVLDYALNEYTLAYQQLLSWARENEVFLKENGQYRGKYNGRVIATLLLKVPTPIHSSLKDALLVDVAGGLASYFALKDMDENVSFPTSRDPHPTAVEDALENFIRVGSEEEDYNESRNILNTAAGGQYMPVFFARPDGATRSRNFSLLWNTDKLQLVAGLWLLPQGHELGKPINAQRGNLVRLDTGEVFKSNSKSAVLVPLEVGQNGWQDMKFLMPSREGEVSVQTAFLVKRGGEYFLHVTFKMPEPKVYEPETWLGMDKGILVTAAYAVIDKKGAVCEIGHEQDDLRHFQQVNGKLRREMAQKGHSINKRHYKTQEINAKLHRLVNNLIDTALKYRAGIVVEDLNPGLQVRGKDVVSRFRKLDDILEYKCKLAGVPFRRVFAAYSSTICPVCGEDMERSSDRQSVWCEHCGFKGHADETASINIARRVLYKKSEWKGYRDFHRSFSGLVVA